MAFIDEGPMLSEDAVLLTHPPLKEHRVDERRDAIKRIIDRRDSTRKIFLHGPCSAWPDSAVLDYAGFAEELQDQVKDKLLLVLRTYIQKPRTTVGWPGPLHQPDPLGIEDMDAGIVYCRKMMWEAAKNHPLADEILYTHNGPYFDDLLSYLAVGARSTEDTDHRNIASGLELPVGLKNGTSGDIAIGVNSVISAQASHYFPHNKRKVRSTGNPYAHLILRGGGGRSNYSPESIALADKLLKEKKVKNPSIVIDASHDNSLNGSGKDPTLQEMVLQTVLLGIASKRPEYANVIGFMIESFNKEGKQSEKGPTFDMSGLSITDACIGQKRMRELTLRSADVIDKLAA